MLFDLTNQSDLQNVNGQNIHMRRKTGTPPKYTSLISPLVFTEVHVVLSFVSPYFM